MTDLPTPTATPRPGRRRVWLTAAAVVCAAGDGLIPFLDALAAGRTGLRPFTRFPTADLATRQGGEVEPQVLATTPMPTILPWRPVWEPLSDVKAVLAWRAMQQLPLSDLASDVGLYCAVGLERVDLAALTATDHATRFSFAPPAPVPSRPSPGATAAATGFGDLAADRIDLRLPEPRRVVPELPPTLLPGLLWRAAGRVGPVAVPVAACAASAIALGQAFRAIARGATDRLVVGGTDSLLFPYGIHAFNSLAALSERNDLGPAALAPFDLHRSGTLLGEGAGFVLLETPESAREARRRPLAEVIGFGGSMDAWHPVMPEPDGRGAEAAMRAALADAGLEPDAVDYLNAHGTGTFHNDVAEARAILRVFGDRARIGETTANNPDGPAAPAHPRPLAVSSTKPFTGHLLTAAGVVEAIACLLPLTRDQLPPTLHHRTPDPDCPLDVVPNLARPATPTVVMTNSYALGGQNASLLLRRIPPEEADAR